ncbi:hypothetical protein D3C74_429580 [compost metagenome]
MNGLGWHIQPAGQIVGPGKTAEGIPVLLPREQHMSGKREVAALHFFMGHAVAFAVISILQLFVAKKKPGEAIQRQLPE